MLTEDQITVIAREYGVDSVDPYGFSKNTYEDFVGEYADAAADVLRWLSKRFCLVEKGKLEEEYNKTVEEGKHCHPKHQIQSRTRMRLLAALFPEIAKEVES